MKRINKKGFTLMEILATVVVLAIVTVISAPIILNVIETSKRKTAIQSVTQYAKAIELAHTEWIYEKSINDNVLPKTTANGYKYDQVVNVDGTEITYGVNYDGAPVENCIATISDKGVLTLEYCTVKNYRSNVKFKYEHGVVKEMKLND